MKHILLILAAAGLTACSKGVVKNESGVDISVAGVETGNGACYEWTVFLGIFGDSSVAIKTLGEGSSQIGDKESYEVGYYVVKGVTAEAASVEKVDKAPQCETPGAGGDDLEAAKAAAVKAAEEAIAAADAAIQSANNMLKSTIHNPPVKVAAEQKKAQATEIKGRADAVKKEAEAADTVEKANAAKTKADAIKAEVEAL